MTAVHPDGGHVDVVRERARQIGHRPRDLLVDPVVVCAYFAGHALGPVAVAAVNDDIGWAPSGTIVLDGLGDRLRYRPASTDEFSGGALSGAGRRIRAMSSRPQDQHRSASATKVQILPAP